MKLNTLRNTVNSFWEKLNNNDSDEHANQKTLISNGPNMMRLEPRIMFDGAAVETATEVFEDSVPEAVLAVTENIAPPAIEDQSNERDIEQLEQIQQVMASQVVVIDQAVSYADQILSDVPEGMDVIIINSDSDGLEQLVQALEGRQDIKSLHIFSHGESGRIYLGSKSYTLEDLQQQSAVLGILGNALASDGDILFYGCDIGADFIGQEFVEQLSILTGADIAASNDATGNIIYGGDWDLEVQNGTIESQTLTAESYADTLTTTTIGIATENINIDIARNGSRLYAQASGRSWWYRSDNHWVDFYNKDAETSYFATRQRTTRFAFWTFRWTEIYTAHYNYGSGVRYGSTTLDITHDSSYDIKVNSNGLLKNQLGGTSDSVLSYGNHALYKGIFDPTNPLSNLVSASESLLSSWLYQGELDAGIYTIVSSFDSYELVNRSNTFWAPILNHYAEQSYGRYTATIDNLNHAPTWAANSLNTTLTGSDEQSYAIPLSSVSDLDGDEMTISAKLQNGSALPSWLSFNVNNFTFSGNAPANTGSLAIRLTADDGQETANKDFTITFNNDNDQPTVAQTIPDQLWNGSGAFSYTVPSGTFIDSDPDADSFTYRATLADNSALPNWLSMASNGVLNGNPPANFADIAIKVIADDGSGQANATQTTTFNLTLANNNDVPVASNVSKTVNEDGVLSFSSTDFSFSDSDTRSSADTLTGSGKTLQTVRILSLTEHGVLWLDTDNDGELDGGEALQTNQEISAANLAKLRYTPDADWASTAGADTFRWIGSDGVDYADSSVSTTINVNLVNDIPTLTFSDGLSLNVRPNGGAVLGSILVDSGLKITDVDGPYTNDPAFDTIKSATVSIVDETSGSFVAGDLLSLSNTGGLTVSYDAALGILTIVGDARATDYQAILRTLRFSSSDTSNNNERTVDIVLRTGEISPTQIVSYDHFTATSGGDSQGWVIDGEPDSGLVRTNDKPDITDSLIKMENNDWVAKGFELGNVATKIQFEFWRVDTWDTENFTIRLRAGTSGPYVDIAESFSFTGPATGNLTGSVTLNGQTVNYAFAPVTAGTSHFVGDTTRNDQKFLVTIELPANTVDKLLLYFKSNLSTLGNDESYRIDNVTLYQDKTSTYSGSIDKFATPGWYSHPDSADGPSDSWWPTYKTVEGSTVLQFAEGQPSKSFKIDNEPTRIEFDFFRLDSWDTEDFIVRIQNTQLFSHSFHLNTEVTTPITGSATINSKAVTYTITPLTFGNFFTDNSNSYNDQKFHIAIDIPIGFGEAFELSFDNNLDEPIDNESVAIDNVRVFTNTPDQFTNASRTVTVRETNNTPTTNHWTAVAIDEDSQLSFNSTNFTNRFSDSDRDTLNAITLTSLPANGALSLNGSVLANNTAIAANDLNQLIFTPSGNFHGSTSFTYTASDGFATSANTTVSITVNSINDAPELNNSLSPELTAIDEDNSTSTGTSVADLIVDNSITEPADGSAVEAIAVTSVDNTFGIWQYNVASAGWTAFTATTGKIVNLNTTARLLDSGDLIRFIPNADYNGTATINFRAWDKSSGSAGSTTDPFALGGNNSVSTQEDGISITINPVNDAPSTGNNTITLDEDSVYSFSADDFDFADIDTSDTLQSVTIASLPVSGSLSWNNGTADVAVTLNQVVTVADINAGKLKFTPVADAFGMGYTEFTFKVGDGSGVSAVATMTLDVTDTNDAPTAISWESGGSVAEDQTTDTVVGKLSATDPNTGEIFSFVRVFNSAFNIRPDGTVTVSSLANLDFESEPSQILKVKVTDSGGLSYIQDIVINITDVVEAAPAFITNLLYAAKDTTTTLTENHLKAVDAQQTPAQLIYTVQNNNSNGGAFWIDLDGDGVQDGNELLAPINEGNPDAVETFSHQNVLDGKIKFTKDNTQQGAKLQLKLSDGGETVDGALIAVSSSPPVVTPADDQEWSTTGAQSFVLPANTFVDPDFDILTLATTLANGDALPAWLSFDASTWIFSGAPEGMLDGDAIDIKVSATDGRTNAVEDTFKLTFLAALTNPSVVTPIATQIFDGSGNKSFTFDANIFSEPNALPLTYSASLSDNSPLPGWLSFDANTRTFSGNPPADAAPEPYWIKVNASSTGGSASNSFKLAVYNPNDLPIAPVLSDKTIADAQMHRYTIQASQFSDGDGDIIELKAISADGSDLPGWILASTDDATGDLILETTAPAGAGSQLVRIVATDGRGGDASTDFSINYSGGVNQAPQVRTSDGLIFFDANATQNRTQTFAALAQYSVSEGSSGLISKLQLSEADPDDDGTGVTFTVTALPAYGELWLDADGDGTVNGAESILLQNDSFTQSDIDNNKLRYRHTGADATDDGFTFSVADGGENGVATLSNINFSIQVLPAPTIPELLIISRDAPLNETTNADELFFRVTFSESVQGVDTADFITTGDLAASAVVESVSHLGGANYLVKLSGADIVNANGTLGIALAAAPSIADFSDTALDENATLLTNEAYILDNIAPTTTLSAQGIHDGSTAFNATISFDETVEEIELADFGITNATLSNLVKTDSQNWQVTVTPTTGLDITLSFALDQVEDGGGNTNIAATSIEITRNILPVLSLQPGSSADLTAVYTELDGADNASNDVAFTTAGISLSDADTGQGISSLNISISSAELVDGATEHLLINGATAGEFILLNFNDADVINDISLNGVDYAVTASINAGNSRLQFTKSAGGMLALSEAEALLDAFRYSNASDDLTDANRVFALTVNDGLDSSLAANLTVDVNPKNDTPTINLSPNAYAVSEADDASGQILSSSGSIIASDLDSTDNLNLSSSISYRNDIVWSGGTLTALQINALTTGLSVDSSSWNYDATVNLDFLAGGETISFSYRVITTDPHGASASTALSFTINGSNDTPTLSIETASAIAEAVNASSQALSDSGNFSTSELDSNDSLTLSNSYNNDISWAGGSLTAAQTNTLINGFSISETGWDYNAILDLDFLSAGEAITFSYTITATDLQGTSDTDIVSVTINGSNDSPTLAAAVISAFIEADATGEQNLNSHGSLNSGDLDSNDRLSIENHYNNDISWSGGSLTESQISNLTRGFGTSDVDWNYIANIDLDFLSVNETIIFSYTVTVTDLQGARATDTIRLSIKGSNDAPSLSVTVASAFTELGDARSQLLANNGSITFDDLDNNDQLTLSSHFNNDINWSGGSLTSAQVDTLRNGFSMSGSDWNYNAALNLDFLSVAETIAFSYTITATDQHGASASDIVKVKINGTNDAPTLTAEAAGTVIEIEDANNQHLTDSGELTFSDLDSNDRITLSNHYNNDINWTGGMLTAPQVETLANGFSLNDARWNYNASLGLDFLSAGDSISFSFTVVATDRQGAIATNEVTIVINATNDSPVVSSITLEDESMGIETNYSKNIAALFSDIDSELQYSFTGLPQGIEFNSATGLLSGVSLFPGLFSITITATDERGASVSRSYRLDIFLPEVIVDDRGSDNNPNTSTVDTSGTGRANGQDASGSGIQEFSKTAVVDVLGTPETEVLDIAIEVNAARGGYLSATGNGFSLRAGESTGLEPFSESEGSGGNDSGFSAEATANNVTDVADSSDSTDTGDDASGMTSSSGQPVAVENNAGGSAGAVAGFNPPSTPSSGDQHEFRLVKRIPEQQVSSGARQIYYLIPADTFFHTDKAANITYKAMMLDGSEMPNWVVFDAIKGEFKGLPPANTTGILEIKVIASDENGKHAEVVVRFRFDASGKLTAIEPAIGITEQFRSSGVLAWKAERNQLIRHAQAIRERSGQSKA